MSAPQAPAAFGFGLRTPDLGLFSVTDEGPVLPFTLQPLTFPYTILAYTFWLLKSRDILSLASSALRGQTFRGGLVEFLDVPLVEKKWRGKN